MNKRTLLLASVVALIIIAAAIVLSTTASAPAASQTAEVARISPAEYVSQFENADHLLVDVRTPEEFASGHIEGAINIPLQSLEARLSEIPRDGEVVVYCRSGSRSAQASTILASSGYTQISDLGGIIDWEAAGYPTVR